MARIRVTCESIRVNHLVTYTEVLGTRSGIQVTYNDRLVDLSSHSEGRWSCQDQNPNRKL
eukprot:scaffold2177_cov115-Cylindrotheca_fusiformis.AAC.2